MSDIRKKLFYIVKYSPIVYTLYYHIGSFCLKVLRLFVRFDDKLILFSSFGGRKYDDSPKVIYERMLSDERFKNYKLIWAFINPEKVQLPDDIKIKCDTLKYYITALKARVWITNSSIERGLSFKGKNTLYFNTWHGTPIKKMGSDISSDNTSFKSKGKNTIDVFTAQGEFEADIFSRVFNIPFEKIEVIGLPRNDVYVNHDENYRNELRKKLNIPLGKKAILYAPTFREYDKSDDLQCKISVPINLDYWEKALGDKYVLLFRAHYEVAKGLNIVDNEFVREMSGYPNLDDLMIASDLLISDYSSIFFDYSIMHKPMYCFAYDYEKYATERGMYFDIRDCLSTSENENDLLKLLTADNESACIEKVKVFQRKYVTAFGNATKYSIDIISRILKA